MTELNAASSPESHPQCLGDRLRTARDHAGLTRAELARRVGVSIDTIEAWEHGDAPPRPNRLQILAGILNVSLRWLLQGREDDAPEPAGAPSVEAVHLELERLHATLGQAKTMVRQSLDRLSELSAHTERDDAA